MGDQPHFEVLLCRTLFKSPTPRPCDSRSACERRQTQRGRAHRARQHTGIEASLTGAQSGSGTDRVMTIRPVGVQRPSGDGFHDAGSEGTLRGSTYRSYFVPVKSAFTSVRPESRRSRSLRRALCRRGHGLESARCRHSPSARNTTFSRVRPSAVEVRLAAGPPRPLPTVLSAQTVRL